MSKQKVLYTVILIASLAVNALFFVLVKNNEDLRSDLKKLFVKVTSQPQEAGPVFYHFSFDKATELEPVENNTTKVPLPGGLMVKPGIYTAAGKTIDMQAEGLYRIMIPFDRNRQVLVYENSLDTLLSSLAWIVTHGNSDNKLPIGQLEDKAAKDKLYLTCGYVTPFVKKVLADAGFKTRTVNLKTTSQKNGYNDAHVMLEVFHPEWQRWVLADIDNNLLFKSSETDSLLDVFEVKRSIDANTVKYYYLSSDVAVDVSGFNDKSGYSFGMYTEALNTEANKTRWYKGVMDNISIAQ